jgi:hypothetical protein
MPSSSLRFHRPFFLLMAVATLLVASGILSVGPGTWKILGDFIAIGGLSLWLLPELYFGRYWQSETAPH